jgi:hypothetical protein
VGCWNHPEYRAFWNATVEDLFRSYELDGFQFGAERQGPLCNMILNPTDGAATCFCPHCVARGKSQGIDADRARKGFVDLIGYLQSLRAGGSIAADGALSGFLRLLFRYPEILAWDYQYRLAREEVLAGMYGTIKRIKPAAPVGWHVDHWAVSMNPFYRAQMSYADMAAHSDFLKIVVYHAILGPRMGGFLNQLHRGVLADLPIEEVFNVYYDLIGYDKTIEPGPRDARTRGFSADYVDRETRHSVASAAGKTRIYPGIAFNIPGGPADDPETVHAAVHGAYRAGAAGIVLSREYEEMTLPNLRAAGAAVRELGAA